jgi:hypothetical protein
MPMPPTTPVGGGPLYIPGKFLGFCFVDGKVLYMPSRFSLKDKDPNSIRFSLRKQKRIWLGNRKIKTQRAKTKRKGSPYITSSPLSELGKMETMDQKIKKRKPA